MRKPKFKLYACICTECDNTIGYTQDANAKIQSLCNDCSASFVRIASLLGVQVYGDDDKPLTPTGIVKAKWHHAGKFEYNVRFNINKWRLHHKTTLANGATMSGNR